jgi:hypothetical protein
VASKKDSGDNSDESMTLTPSSERLRLLEWSGVDGRMTCSKGEGMLNGWVTQRRDADNKAVGERRATREKGGGVLMFGFSSTSCDSYHQVTLAHVLLQHAVFPSFY